MIYSFIKENLIYILVVNFSKIGYHYKNIYVMWPNGSHSNFDLELFAHFKCSAEVWQRLWMTSTLLDEEEVWEDVLTENGIRWPNLEEMCLDILKDYREQF